MFIDCVWNVTAHAQKPDFVFRRKGRVHLNRQGRQFSRLLAAELCASAVVMLDTPCSGLVKGTGNPLHWPVSPSLPLPCVTVCHHVSTGLYLLGHPQCPVPYESKRALLWQSNGVGNTKTHLIFVEMPDIFARFEPNLDSSDRFSWKFPISNFTDSRPVGVALMVRTDWRKWSE